MFGGPPFITSLGLPPYGILAAMLALHLLT
jgi:hypothetical protein